MVNRLLLLLLLITPMTQANIDKFNPKIAENKQHYVGLPLHIQIYKEEKVVELYVLKGPKYQLIESYPICNFSGGLGPKKREGDLKSPEGFYRITADSLNPNSRYHLSFNLGYPNDFDQENGYTGSYLMVHGGCSSVGCYAIGNDHIEELYYFMNQAFNYGQAYIDVHIYPFKMSNKNLQRHQKTAYYDFWLQLKPGYDHFEQNKYPSLVYSSQGKYFVFPQTGQPLFKE